MDPTGYAGLGAMLQIDTGGGVFETIPGCDDLTGPGKTRDTIETTSLDSVDGYKTFITGLRDGGEVSTALNWLGDDPTQALLDVAFDSDDPVNFQLVCPFTPLNETFHWVGLVTNLSHAFPKNDKVTRSLTIKVTGPVTQTNDDD